LCDRWRRYSSWYWIEISKIDRRQNR